MVEPAWSADTRLMVKMGHIVSGGGGVLGCAKITFFSENKHNIMPDMYKILHKHITKRTRA